MIKVFTCGNEPRTAGDELTKKIEEWKTTLNQEVEILNIHSNSNKFGWMIVLQYKFVS